MNVTKTHITDIAHDVGVTLRSIRLMQNKTQIEVCQKIEVSQKSGLTQASLSRIESGSSSGNLATIYLIATALNINLSELFLHVETDRKNQDTFKKKFKNLLSVAK